MEPDALVGVRYQFGQDCVCVCVCSRRLHLIITIIMIICNQEHKVRPDSTMRRCDDEVAVVVLIEDAAKAEPRSTSSELAQQCHRRAL